MQRRSNDKAWRAIKLRVLERDNFTCAYCGTEVIDSQTSKQGWSVDHIIPLALGGSNDESNLVVACRLCNSKKGTKTITRKLWQSYEFDGYR